MKNYFQKIAILLVVTLGISFLPSKNIVFADEVQPEIIQQQDNEQEEPSIVKEIEELREEYSKKFLKSDGTFEAVVYNKPIHYKEGDRWIEINNTLEEKIDEDLKVLDESDENISNSNEDNNTSKSETIEEKEEDLKEDYKDEINDTNEEKEEIIKEEEIKNEEKEEVIKEETSEENDIEINNNDNEIDKEQKHQDENKEKEKNENLVEENKSEIKEGLENIKEKEENIEETDEKSKFNNINKSEDKNILTNKNNNFSVNISKYSDSKKLIKIYKDNYELSWSMNNVNSVKYENVIKNNEIVKAEIDKLVNKRINENNKKKNKKQIEKDKNTIRQNEEKKTLKNISTGVNYKNIFPNIDLNYTIDSNMVKENIIINDKVDSSEFEFTIKVKNLVAKNVNGEIKFYDVNNQSIEVFSIEKPFMYDKVGSDSTNIKLEFEEVKEGYKLKLIADKEWINSSERSFPIVIDPIVSTSQVRTDIFDTFTRQNDSENKYSNQFLRVGNNSGSITRSFLKFNIPTFDTSNTITSAYMNLVLYNAPVANQVNVHKVTSSYSTSVSNGYVYSNLLWANMPSNNNRIEDYQVVSGSDKVVSFDITRIVKEWYTTGVNNGVLLKSNDESVADSIFWSSDMNDVYNDYRPVIQYNYINNSGLEGYWTYHSQDVGRLGTGNINDYNGNLVFTLPLISDSGNRMPVSLSLVYNSKQKNNKDIGGTPLGFGNGWRLNLSQRIVKATVSGQEYYKYIDGDGTEHYFTYDSASGKYKDLSGLDLTMQLSYDNGYDKGYLIEDKKNNKYIFTASGYLYKIEDSNKNSMSLQYEGATLKYIIDGTGRKTKLDVLSNGYLVGIIDSNGRRISLGYKGIQLNRIIYADNKESIINYDSNDRLIEAQNYDGYKMRYEYSSGVDSKVTKTYEVFNDGTTGQALNITYGYNTTTFKDLQGRKEVYQFNNWGNTISVIDSNGRGTYYKYGQVNNVNKLELTSKLQNTITNYLLNHNAEVLNTQWTYDYWTGSNGNGQFTTEDKYLGNTSLKITKSNATARSFFSQSVLLEKGKTYTFSGYAKAKGITSSMKGAAIFVNYQNKDGSYSTVESNFLSGTTNWEKVSLTFTLPVDAASNSVYFRTGIVDGTGIAYFDCLQVEDGLIANRYNLVENPSFKTDGGKLGSLYWSASGYDSTNALLNSSDSTYPSIIDSYKTVYKMGGFSNKSKNVYQSIPVSGKKGDVFVASGWARGESVPLTKGSGRYFAIDVGIEKIDGTYQWVVIPFNEDTDEWQYASDRVIADSDYKRVIIYGLYYNNANNAYFDNFQLYKEEFGQSYQYDSKGNVVSSKDLNQKNSTFEYNGTNDLIKTIDPKGGSYNYTYDANHNVKTATTAENVVYSFQYDSYGNPITSKTTSASEEMFLKSEATYTGDGNYIRTVTDGPEPTVIYNYDDEVPGSSNTKTILKGNVTAITDANNSTTFYRYDINTDALTKAYKTVDGKEIANSYTYENDRLKTINHNGFNYTFNYDKAGNNKEVLVGNQKLITNNYNLLTGNLDSSIYGNGHTVTYQYDNLDRIIGKKFNGDTQNRYAYEYDGNGNLAVQKDNSNGTSLRYLYDFSDRLSKVVDSIDNTFNINYDANNNVSDFEEKYTYYNSNFKTSYIYDKDNKQKEVNYITDGRSNKISFNYDELGRLNTKSINTGSATYNTSLTYVKGYAERETNLVSSYINGSKKIEYTYDSLKNIKSIVSNGKTITFTYNELNELIREDNGVLNKTIVYTYDVGGNILDKKEYQYTTDTLGEVTSTKSYTYGDVNWKDKLTAYDGKAITYDAIGNPLTYDGNTYSWEGGRRLKGITGNNNNISYKYNDSGIRTEKTVNGAKTEYILSGDKVLSEARTYEEANYERIHYTYDASNNLVSMNIWDHRGSKTNGEYYYIRNAQGDIIGLTDVSGTQVVTYNYDTWGKLISIEGNLTVGQKNPYRYRGYRYDNETGLYYLNARYYNPEWGRFINADALAGEKGTLLSHNGFAYCFNNPVNMEDPTGYIAWWIIGAGVGAIAGGIVGAIISKKKTGTVNWKYVAAGAGIGALGGAGLGYLAKTAYGVASAAISTAGAAAQRMENARKLGQQGEQAANIVKNTERIKSLTNTAKYRVPDALSKTTLTEIKNVKYQALTNQIKDFVLWSEQEGLEFVLKTRLDTKISAPLQNLIDEGKIIHLFIGN